MIKINSILMIVLAGVLLVLGGCRSNPVMNVDDAAIVINQNHTERDIKKAIITASQSLGWQMKEQKPGVLEGKLFLRKHVAVIGIHYDKTKYSIKYKDSTNLNYDGVNIHSNYNGWIQNLHRGIQTQLSTL